MLVVCSNVKQTDNLTPSFFDYSERRPITLSNTPKMADLYYLDYQYVIKSLFFKAQKMAILALKVRLTCVVSVVHLRGKTYAFTKKYTTLTNQPVFF